MPRPRRVHIEEGALYLVSSKAAQGKRLFQDWEDYEAYLNLLEGYRKQFGFHLYAYTLLPSELHLCMQMKGGVTASSVMHALNSRYTKFYMKRHGRVDHLFQGRFKSTLMEKELYLLRMTCYLHALVEQGTVPAPQAVRGQSPETYPWSSYPSYVKGEALPPLEIHREIQEVLKVLGMEWPGISYQDYLRSVPNFRWEEFGKELEEQALGSQSFLNLVEQKGKKSKLVTVTPPQSVLHQTVGGRPAEVFVADVGGQASGDSPQDPKEPKPEPRPDPVPMPIQPPRRLQSLALMASVVATCLALGGVGLTLVGKVTVTQGDSHLEQASVAAASLLANFAVPTGLDGTSWEVRMKPMYATGNGQPQRDEIEFHKSRIASAKLTAEGFSDSKYTVSQKPNGILRWETMQRGPGGERVFWRGEWDGKTMRGVVSRQVPGSQPLDYNFVGMKGESQETGRTL